jgi:hypothetical protein
MIVGIAIIFAAILLLVASALGFDLGADIHRRRCAAKASM